MRRALRSVCLYSDPVLRPLRYGALVLIITWALCGCVSNVNIPPIERFNMVTSAQSGPIDAASHEDLLLNDLYRLMLANEGEKVSLCTAEKETKTCVKKGVSVFVQGGPIPGFGKRKHNIFKEIKRDADSLTFIKNNSSTSFIGIPMYAKENQCEVFVRNGGLQVEMTKYYANWVGAGMYMAEGWAIDYIDLPKGIIGCQLALDIKGILTAGGGSNYVLLQFPNTPEPSSPAGAGYRFVQ